MPVATQKAKHLKLYSERSNKIVRPEADQLGSLGAVLKAFRRATGWSLRYQAGPEPNDRKDLTWSAPVNPGVGTALGHLRLDPIDSTSTKAKRKPLGVAIARQMASAVTGMVDELMAARHALWQREAELAAGVPLIPHLEEQGHLAERLQAVLQAGAESLDCQAAALYLLDEATTELKIRSSWGLPFDRMTAPARQLRGAVADLEALLGHAVVLQDAETMRRWQVPENFATVACVPVSTPTTLLGTLWIYSETPRDFSDRQTNLLEVVAGRVASDLEREMLMRESVDGAKLKRQAAAAERLQRHQLPTISPLLDGWQAAGWTVQAETVGGDFYDWFCPPNGLLTVAIGDVMDRGLEAAMSAATVRTALRAHGQYHRHPEQTLKQVNLTLWTTSAGDQYASVFLGLIETATGRVCCCSAGQPGAIVIRPDGWQSLAQTSLPLGEGPETPYEQFGYELQVGEALVLFTDGLRDAADDRGRPLGESGIAEALTGRLDLTADQLSSIVRDTFEAHAAESNRDDCTVLVVKRTPA
ncbi:MAG: SpoIIE family protein phosphatase [Candidatus Nealsonbacteria bacterium]|nr:SpoIIE family protein phosphatase [Candidatus Nealsonbacteria bacterium]